MHSYSASRLVGDEPAAVPEAIGHLVDAIWGSRARLVVLDDTQRVDAIAARDGTDEADVWITWTWTPEEGGTEVLLALDEVDRGPDPSADLAKILDVLAERIGSR